MEIAYLQGRPLSGFLPQLSFFFYMLSIHSPLYYAILNKLYELVRYIHFKIFKRVYNPVLQGNTIILFVVNPSYS